MPPRAPGTALLLRVVVALGPVAALALGELAGHPPSATVLVVAAVLALAHAARPDAWPGTVVMIGVVAWWAQALDADLPVAVLPATLCLTAAHVCALLADQGPRGLPLDAAVARLWALRGGAVVGAATALWALARLVDDVAVPGLWVVAVALGALAALAAALVLARSQQP